MTQAVAGKGRVHNHQVGRFGHGNLIAGVNLRYQLRRIGPRHYARLPVAQKLQRPQMRLAGVVNPQPHPPNLQTAKMSGGRQQPQRGGGHMRCRQVNVKSAQHLLNERAGQMGIVPRLRRKLADAFYRGHQQSSGAAGRIGYPQPGDGVSVLPVT